MDKPLENRQRAVVPVEVDGKWEYINVLARDANEARTVAGTLCSREKPPGSKVRVATPKDIVWTGDRS